MAVCVNLLNSYYLDSSLVLTAFSDYQERGDRARALGANFENKEITSQGKYT